MLGDCTPISWRATVVLSHPTREATSACVMFRVFRSRRSSAPIEQVPIRAIVASMLQAVKRFFAASALQPGETSLGYGLRSDESGPENDR